MISKSCSTDSRRSEPSILAAPPNSINRSGYSVCPLTPLRPSQGFWSNGLFPFRSRTHFSSLLWCNFSRSFHFRPTRSLRCCNLGPAATRHGVERQIPPKNNRRNWEFDIRRLNTYDQSSDEEPFPSDCDALDPDRALYHVAGCCSRRSFGLRGVDIMSTTLTGPRRNGSIPAQHPFPLLCPRTRSCSSTAQTFPIGSQANGSWWMVAWNP